MFSGVRQIHTIPGVPVPLANPQAKDIDLVILRGSTEGLFKGRENGKITDDERARETNAMLERI